MDDNSSAEKFLIHLDMGDVLDQDQLDMLTRQLQREILDQDVETVNIVSGDQVPEGTKGAGAVTWGALAIEVLPTFLPSVFEFLKSWTMREKSRKVVIQTQVGDRSIKIDYSSIGTKDEELKELLNILSTNMQSNVVQTPIVERAVQPTTQEDVDEKNEEISLTTSVEIKDAQNEEFKVDQPEATKAEVQKEQEPEAPQVEDVVEEQPEVEETASSEGGEEKDQSESEMEKR